MNFDHQKILETLDQCAKNFTFPVLDNGYVYLAATRMSVYRSDNDWAIVIEVFGFSPRSGDPDIQIYTFSSHLVNRNSRDNYISDEAYANYIENNQYNESSFIYPVDNDDWKNEENHEYTSFRGSSSIRGKSIQLPENVKYQKFGIILEEDTPLTFEFCRFLAEKYRDKVLCTGEERRINIARNMELILVLEEWKHPDITEGEFPSQIETFKQIADVLVSGDREKYCPLLPPNTHWSNWPEGGTL